MYPDILKTSFFEVRVLISSIYSLDFFSCCRYYNNCISCSSTIIVNFQSRTPVYQQLYDDVVRLASLGVLKSNTKLPPVRVLATELGINPNTVSKAYKMLEADGYIYSTVGRGSFVSDKLCQDEAEKIAARQELKSALKKAYKKGVTKEEIVNMIEQIIEGVDIE